MHNLIPQKHSYQPRLRVENAYEISYERPWKEGESVAIDLPKCTTERIKGKCLSALLGDLDRRHEFEAVYANPLSPIFKTIDAAILTGNKYAGGGIKYAREEGGDETADEGVEIPGTERVGEENRRKAQAKPLLRNPLIFLQYTTAQDHSLVMEALNTLWKQVRHRYGSLENGFTYPVFYFVVPSYRGRFMPKPPKFSRDAQQKKEEKELLDRISFYVIVISEGTCDIAPLPMLSENA